ncbi:MAG: T9SS type A sorting domain-containing protein, partial [Bacteroidota bacterium]
ALLAVWNADELAARDTVVEMFDIHSRELYAVNYILVGADSTLAWMQELEAGNIPCGNDTVDSLINRYSLNLTNYYSHAWEDWPRFDGESNLNMGPLGRLFLPIYGVQYVDTLVNTVLDGDRIDFSINSEFVELTYSYGWGDCLNGCMYRRYWKFNVYYDCSVEYMGSYGNVLEDMSVFAQNKEAQIEIYPNPVKNRLKLKLHDYALRNEYQLEICSLSGQKLLSKDIYKSTSLDLSDYSPGIYLLIIKHNNKIIQEEKIIVE